ncbi:MAG: hypothetical protein E7491_04975 [Ruminococcaceae bacterium]|nr:hypothetical protein [Oscillospiraceae bacterium]
MHKLKKLFAFILAASFLFTMLSVGTAFAANLTITQIEDQYAGDDIYIGGIKTDGMVNIKIYAPNSSSVWKENTVSIAPNHTYSWRVTLPEDVVGTYRVVVDNTLEMTFNVTKRPENDNPFAGASGNIVSDMTDYEASVAGIRVYIDGVAQKFSTAAYDKNGEVIVPLFELADALNIHYAVENDKLLLTKSRDSLELDKDTMDISVKTVAEAFDYKFTYNAEAKICSVGMKEGSEWWFKELPTQAESGYVDSSETNTSRQNYGADFAWGILAQRASLNETIKDIRKKQADGIRLLSYFEASGTISTFAVGYKNPGDFSKLYDLNAWAFQIVGKNGSQYVTYVGIHNEINDEDVSKNIAPREQLGYSIPTYPDGSSALGFNSNSDLPYPLNARFYDMAVTRGISGNMVLDFSMEYSAPDLQGDIITMTVGSKYLPTYAGKNAGDKVSFLSVGMSKDVAAPFWLEHAHVVGREFAKNGMDGAWFDNMSPWDNFQGVYNGFGKWSEAKFNTWLSEKYTPSQLSSFGIDSLNSFNIRQYMVNVAKEWGVTDAESSGSPIYALTIWHDDIIWNLYKVFKAEVGSTYLRNMYNIMKEESELAGNTEGFMVIGNDMPAINHGWITDEWLDMCGTEIGTGWSLTFGSKGLGNIPDGKMSVMYHAGTEMQSGRYGATWFYADGELAGGKTETGKVLAAEAFANNFFIKRADNTVTTDESQRWLNRFLYANEEAFGTRYTRYEIAIVLSTENQLANMVPANMTGSDMNKQYHMQGIWGFAHALTDANVPYRIIPEWKINDQTLKNVKTLILPNVEAMDEDMFAYYLRYAQNGGRLVITGPTGARYGSDGAFMLRDEALFDKYVGVDSSNTPGISLEYSAEYSEEYVTAKCGKGTIIWTGEPVGHTYFSMQGYRDDLRPLILEMVGNTVTLLDASQLPKTVGAYLMQSADGQSVFVDLVNYNCNISSDTVTPTGKLTFKVKLPVGLTNVKAEVLSPDGNYNVTPVVADGWATITVDKVNIYSSVKISGASTYVPASPTLNGEPSAWAKEEILKALEADLVPAHVNSNYTTDITRSDFCDLIIKMIEKKSGKAIADVIAGYADAKAEVSFPDTDSANVIAAAKLGIVNGRSSGAFDPKANITRQEAAKMLALAAKVLGADITASEVAFADADDIYAWAKEFIYYVNTIGVMNGTSTTTPPNFSPLRTYTREQSILTVYRLFNAL